MSHLAQIPDDPREQAQWLQTALHANNFGELVTELAVLRELGETASPASPRELPPPRKLQEILGAQRQGFLEQGVSALDSEQVQELIATPSALLDLQELMLLEGQSATIALANKAAPAVQDSTARSSRNRWMALAATAAALLLAFVLWPGGNPQGWLADGALAPAAPNVYLTRLAAAGIAGWEAEQPGTAEELKAHLGVILRGCQRLIDAPHPSLTDTDANWLRERCIAWREKLTAEVTALDQGKEATAVIAATDKILRNAAKMLRERAAQLEA